MMLRIMSRPRRFVCKLLLLVCLCAVSSAQENDTETTTAKAEAGSSGAETSRVETVHLHGQETQPKSYSYSGNVAGYLDQEPIYSHQQNEDETYEYGKRVGGGQYKGSSNDNYNQSPSGYHHPKEDAHHSGYEDSYDKYGQRQINGHDQSGGKGSSYSQLGKQVAYGQEDYGKDTSAYAQGYSDGNDKQVAYGYDEPKIHQQEYVHDDVYGSKDFGSHSNYGVEDAQVSKGTGYEDVSSYDTGSKIYNFPPKQPSPKKSAYSSGTGLYSGKSSSGDIAYGSGAHSGGKSSSGDIAYGSGAHSGGKSSFGDIAYGSGPHSGGKSSSGGISYGSGAHSDGKSSYGDIAYGSGPYSGGKSSSGDIAYGSGAHSGGKSSFGDAAYESGPHTGGKSSYGDISYGSGAHSGGKSSSGDTGYGSGGIAYGSGGHSDGKSSFGDIAYGSGAQSGGKSSFGDIAYGSGGHSGGKSSSGDISYGSGAYSGGKSLSGNNGYESAGYSGGKSSGNVAYGSGAHSSGDISYGSGAHSSGDISYGSGAYSGGKSLSGNNAYESTGYAGGKSSGNVAYGSGAHSSGGKSSDGEHAYLPGAYSSGAYSPSGKSLYGGISHSSGAGDYSSGAKSLSGGGDYAYGVADYASSGKSSHFPVYPKEAGYISGGSKESSYSKGGSIHTDDGLYQGPSSGGSDHGKVSVFIKQLGHSEIGDKYGVKTGERHGYLLLPVVPGKEGDKIKISTTGSHSGNGYKSAAQDDYYRRPVHASNGKSSFTSFFKTGGSSYGVEGKSAYSSGAGYGLGGASYGGHSKLAYNSGGGYSSGGHEGQKFTSTEHGAYEAHSGSPKGTSYVAEYPAQGGQEYAQKGFPTYEVHSSGQEGGHGILSQNVKYIPSQEYQKQQYANHDTSYGKSAQQYQPSGKGTPYVKESSGYQHQSGHASASKGYDHGQIEQTSYGHGGGVIAIPGNVKYISQSQDYEKQQPYGGHNIASYGPATSQKQINIKGTDFQPTNYKFSTPIVNPHASDTSSYGGNHNYKSALGNQESSGHQSSNNYGQPKGTSYNRKPKSLALILQRHQGGQQGKGGYRPPTFPVKTEVAKSGYSSQGFQPILPKHAGGGAGRSTSLHYNVKSYQASPSYSAIDHTKGATQFY